MNAPRLPGVIYGRDSPSGLWETRGRVTKTRRSREAADPVVGKRLWAAADELTGVDYL